MPNVRHLLGLLWTHLSSRLWTTSRPDKNHKLKVVPSFGNVLLSLFREEDAPGQGRSLLRYTLVRSSDLRCPVHWLNWIILLQGFSSLIWMEAKKRKNMENIKKKKYYWISEKKDMWQFKHESDNKAQVIICELLSCVFIVWRSVWIQGPVKYLPS